MPQYAEVFGTPLEMIYSSLRTYDHEQLVIDCWNMRKRKWWLVKNCSEYTGIQ